MSDLTASMREALGRLCRNMVWADARSVNALVRRGLAERRGRIEGDELLGSFDIVVATEAGRRAFYEEVGDGA